MLLDEVDHLGVLEQAVAHRLENVVHHDGGGLALGDRLAGGVELIFCQMSGIVAGVEGDVRGRRVAPLVQIDVLVLQGVGQLVRQHRLLFVDAHPIQQIDGLGFGVVVGLDLLLQQGQQKRLQVEIAIKKAEFLEHDFAALHAFGILIFVELLVQIASTAARVVSRRFTSLLIGKPVSCDENLSSSSTRPKSCLA